MPSARIIMKIIAACLSPLLVACSMGPLVKHPTSVQDAKAMTASYTPAYEYTINTGDVLAVKLFYNPDLNEEVVVRPDGRISLQLVGEIVAAGQTPAQLTKQLTERYSKEVRDPRVTVIVKSFAAQKVYVEGEVGRPTLLDLTTRTTILQSIAAAGGFKDTARVNEVILIRRGPDNKPLAIPVNLKLALNGSDMSQDLPLMPYDLVYVPRSPISNADLWVEQNIDKLLPSDLLTIWLISKN
jgi:polysaccharide export outer membrane protein